MNSADEPKIFQQLHESGTIGDEEFARLTKAEWENRAAVTAIIPLAEGKPAVDVEGRDGSVFICRRLSGLRLAPQEWCDWVDPPEARPGELSDGMAISCPTASGLGRVGGWTPTSTGT
jgi:hypothetical protein